MRRTIALILCGFALLLSGRPALASEIVWGDSLEKAMVTARKTGKPILIDLYADWCGWCKRLDKDVYTDATVIKTAGQFIPVKLDTERNGRDVARQYQVSSLPTILVVNAEGEVEARLTGYSPALQFNATITAIAEQHREMPGLKKQYRSDPTNVEVAAKLTRIYSQRGNRTEAERTLARVAKLDPTDAKGQYAKSLNAVADMYAAHKQYDNAISRFRRAVKVGKDEKVIGYGQLSLAVCEFHQGNLINAQSELKVALAHPKINERDKADARKLLEYMEKNTQ